MDERWQEQLPFYVAGALGDDERAAVELHLAGCAACRRVAAEWRGIAKLTRDAGAAAAGMLPPLSPVVRAALVPRPTPAQAAGATLVMIWSQRVLLARGALVPALLLLLLGGLLAIAAAAEGSAVGLALMALVPLAAVPAVAFVFGPDADPAFELVAAAPTPAGTVLFARLTLVLGAFTCLALGGSVPLGALTGAALPALIAAWLGPLLLVSALTTVLALLWRPSVAVGVALALWGMVVGLLSLELQGERLTDVSLLPLLRPDWSLFVLQVALSGLLWALGGRLLRQAHLGQER